MRYKKIIGLLVLPLLLWSLSVKAVERHNEETGPSGTVYFFLKMAYPTPIEQLAFMSKVHNYPGLKVFTSHKGLTEDEMIAFKQNPSAFVERAAPVPKSYQPDPEKLQRIAASIQDMDMVEADEDVVARYNVQNFPSFIYLTPTGALYRFPFKAFSSDAAETEFWYILDKNKSKRKMWKSKKWSQ